MIGWNGTSASWRGFTPTRRCARGSAAAIGVPACTSVLALERAVPERGVKRFGLVTPYLDDVQATIIAQLPRRGLRVRRRASPRHCATTSAFAEVDAATLRARVRDVAAARPDAIAILCTNLRGGPLVAELEAETGIPIHDSVATVVWKSLQLVGADPRRVDGWGRLFDEASA